MINIVVPMAGRGSRFIKEGYTTPKPLIKIHNHCMIEYVIKNIRPSTEYRFIFLCLQEHIDKYRIDVFLKSVEPKCIVIPVVGVTEGAACTVLLAERYIDNDSELMIANSDQYIDFSIDKYLEKAVTSDGMIMTMHATGKKWSYIKLDSNNHVSLLREKEEISNIATTGIYNFKRGLDFVEHAKNMIRQNLRVNNEFYVAPVYNLLIEGGKKITTYNIGSVDDGMYGLGVPNDLKKFINNNWSEDIF